MYIKYKIHQIIQYILDFTPLNLNTLGDQINLPPAKHHSRRHPIDLSHAHQSLSRTRSEFRIQTHLIMRDWRSRRIHHEPVWPFAIRQLISPCSALQCPLSVPRLHSCQSWELSTSENGPHPSWRNICEYDPLDPQRGG